MFRKYIIILFLLGVTVVNSLSQDATDCQATLNTAIEEFNAGHFTQISTLLNDCLDKFSREQRERAYLLLTQTYLLLDDPFAAEQSYLALLKANPEFIADENRDPIDVVYLSKKFTATPIFTYYLNIGSNISTTTVLNSWTSFGDNYSAKEYSLRPGAQFGGGLEYNFDDNLVAGAEINYAYTSFKVTQRFDGNNKVEAIDRQNWISIPLIAKYVTSKGKLRPYGYLGYSFNFLLKDNVNIKRINESNTTTASSPDINYTRHRNTFNRAFIFGGGVRYKFGLDYLFADARFSFGATNLTKPEVRYEYSTDLFDYTYVEDDFRMNNIFVSVGFVHPLYKPRKLKKARTKSVMRRIDKQKVDEN